MTSRLCTQGSGGAFEGTGQITMTESEDIIAVTPTRTVVEVSADANNSVNVEIAYGAPAPAIIGTGDTLHVPPGAVRVVEQFTGAQIRLRGAPGIVYRVTAW